MKRVVAGPTLSVTLHGGVPSGARAALESLLERVARVAPRPPEHARASLRRTRATAFVAKAELDVGRSTVRAHAEGASGSEAIGALERRLRRNVRALAGRLEARRH